jgi:hypothetical protein
MELYFMGGGSGRGGHWVHGNYLARMRARRQVLAATEADLRERGLPIPKVPMSQEKVLAIVLLFGLVGLLAWFFLWKLA